MMQVLIFVGRKAGKFGDLHMFYGKNVENSQNRSRKFSKILNLQKHDFGRAKAFVRRKIASKNLSTGGSTKLYLVDYEGVNSLLVVLGSGGSEDA